MIHILTVPYPNEKTISFSAHWLLSDPRQHDQKFTRLSRREMGRGPKTSLLPKLGTSYEGDPDLPHARRYRDYVIDSFNRDKPYDRFIKEQIADFIPAETFQQRRY